MLAITCIGVARALGLLGAAAGLVLPWCSVYGPTYCQLRVRLLNGQLEWQPCKEHVCTDDDSPTGYSDCEDLVYDFGGNTYRSCECPSPSHTLGGCWTLLRDAGTPNAKLLCERANCANPCIEIPLDANFLPRCICP